MLPLGRFNELIQLLLDDDISATQMQELTEIAASDEALLTHLQQCLLVSDRLSQYEDQLRSDTRFMDSLYVRIGADADSAEFVNQVVASVRDNSSRRLRESARVHSLAKHRPQRTRHIRPGFAGWITAAIALVVLASVLMLQREQVISAVVPDNSEEINDLGVAVLTHVSDLVGEGVTELEVGETIPPRVIEWDAGVIQFEFYSGATVVVEGPAEIEIVDESRVVCRSGRLRAHVPEAARGFAVLAPTFELVDLGTEFGLNVSDDGQSEVHVFDGTVELYDAESNRNQATRRELNAGDALTVDRDGSSKAITARDADFVTPSRLSTLMDVRQQEQLRDWRAFRDSLHEDPRVVAYFPFDRNESEDRLLVGQSGVDTTIQGAIVGCEWSEGRWPGKTSLQFKRPGDRVRITVPGEFESLTYSTWVRVDGLDRTQHSLLLTDGFGKNALHWQIRQDGALVLGVRYTKDITYNYRTDSIFNLFRLGQWSHLATVYDSDQSLVSHYVNGKLTRRESLIDAASGVLKIGNATIGNWSVPTQKHHGSRVRNFNGCIDEMIVFGVALDEQEVRHIYDVGRR